jgi:hypothetical protein
LDCACKCFHLEENVCGKWKYWGNLSLDVEALTKQTWRPVVRKVKKKVKTTDRPSLPKFLQEEIGSPHIFFCPTKNLSG